MTDKIDVFGVELPVPYEGFMATEGICILKGIDSDGDMSMTVRSSDGLMSWDTIGLLTTALDMAKASVSAHYRNTDDLDDEGA